MTRRLAVLLPALLFADDRTDVLDVISPLAAALSNGDAEAFLRRIPSQVPDRSRLADHVRGLMAQAEVTSSVQVRSVQEGEAELDWYIEIRSRATQAVIERRKGTVVVRVANRELQSIKPVDFFRPVDVL